MSKEILDSLKEKILKLEKELVSIKSQILELTNEETSKEEIQNKTFEIKRPLGSVEVTESKKSKLDFEILLGGNILGKLGIFAILLAISWFLKYAFDNELVNESVRIFLGLIFGFIFISWGLILTPKKMKILPESLVGLGISIFYISIYSGYYFYNFFGINETFIYLFLISFSISILSGFINSETLYGFSLLGSILSPMLLSSGENSYRFLFSYLTIINLIYIYISTKTIWRVAPYILVFSNMVLYSGWDLNKTGNTNFYYPLAFLSLTFLLFSFRELYIIPKRSLNFSKSSSVLFLFIFIYFIGNLATVIHLNLNSLFSIQNLFYIGILFGLNHFMEKRILESKIEKFILPRSIFLVLIGLLFLNALNSFFDETNLSFSFILLFSLISFIAIQEKNKIYLITSLILWGILVFRLVFFNTNYSEHRFIILNARFLNYFATSLSLLFLYRLQKKEFETNFMNFFIYSSIFILIFGSLIEVYYFINNASYRNLGYTYTILIYAALFLFFGFKNNYHSFRRVGLLLSSILILKFYLYDIWNLSVLVRIIAGLSLGIALISLNTVYQKFKDKISMDKILKILIGLSLFANLISPKEIFADSFKSSSYHFKSEIELNSNYNKSIDKGKFFITEEISKFHGLNDLRLVYKDKLIPFYIDESKNKPNQIKETKPTVIFSKTNEKGITYVLKLDSIPKNHQYFEIEFSNSDNYESNVEVSLGESSDNFGTSFNLKVYKYSDSVNTSKIEFQAGKYRYVRLYFDTKSEFDFINAKYKKIEQNLEYATDIQISELKKNTDSDRNGTNYYYVNEEKKPISRIELNFSNEKFNRNLEVYEKKSDSKKYEMIGSNFLSRTKGKENFSVPLSNYSGGEIKILILNGDDEELNLISFKLYSQIYEIIFQIPKEFQNNDKIDFYYGNKYAYKPNFDFFSTLNEEKIEYLDFKLGQHSENKSFSLSLIEPPISIWILRILFLVGFILFLFPMYNLLKKYKDSFV